MGRLPFPMALAPTRATTTSSTTSHLSRTTSATQLRHATYVARPRRPYTFTQLVQLSDGSSYTVRTTSPQPLYRTTKDTRNTLLWQPSEKTLKNVEVDEAGKLAAFRDRFGRAFDQQQSEEDEAAQQGDEGYGDLISSYAPDRSSEMKETVTAPRPSGKKKK